MKIQRVKLHSKTDISQSSQSFATLEQFHHLNLNLSVCCLIFHISWKFIFYVLVGGPWFCFSIPQEFPIPYSQCTSDFSSGQVWFLIFIIYRYLLLTYLPTYLLTHLLTNLLTYFYSLLLTFTVFYLLLLTFTYFYLLLPPFTYFYLLLLTVTYV